MAKYDITYSCGHSDTVQLYGPGKDRESKIAWCERSGSCPACYRAKKNAERLAANQAAAEANQLAALPALTGSEKQIAWAESIRKSVAEALRKIDAGGANSKLSAAAQQEVTDAMALVVDEVLGQTEAKWWIDHRGTNAQPASSSEINEIVRARNLIPLASEELKMLTAAKQDQARQDLERLEAAMSAVLKDSGATTPFGDTIYTVADDLVEIDQHGNLTKCTVSNDFTLTAIFGGQWEVTLNGRRVSLPSGHRTIGGRLLGAARDAARRVNARRAAEAQAAFEGSLPGVSVVSVETNKKRSEPNLIATLSDGRKAAGRYNKGQQFAAITEIWTNYGRKIGSLLGTHPEAIRLANEAKAKL